MKKLLTVLLISVMMLSLAACGGKQEEGRKIGGTLIIGNTTEMTGDWITIFSNIATDNEVLNLISGYSTVDLTFDGEYVINETAVKDYKRIENADGSITYEFEINKGLKYSNDVEITAKDYVAGILLWNSKFIADLGGTNTGSFRLVGHDSYSKGETKEFAGVRLLDDYKFSVTIDAAYLPYFYELPLVGYGPEYLPFWLGDSVDVADDGNGAYFTVEVTKEDFEDIFTAARNNPKYVSSGPYVVEEYDVASKQVTLKINPNFKGNYEGQKPSIETVILKLVNQDTMMDELRTGQVDLLYGVVAGDTIQAGHDLVESGIGISYNAYPRSGYGKIHFVADHGPTQFKEVRQAVAHLINRTEFIQAFAKGYGSVVHGPYGEGQWFYQETRQELLSKVNEYPYSLEAAKKLLDEGGWNLDANGKPYTGEGIRHKMVGEELMPLVIKWFGSANNQFTDLLAIRLLQNPDIEAAGMKFEQTVGDFGELINWYTRTGGEQYTVPTYHMFNLATSFTPIYDLQRSYKPGDRVNYNRIADEELYNLAVKLVNRPATDREGFKKDFVNFIVRWNELLPDIPLYSNTLHDFFNEKLKDWGLTANIRLVHAILYAYIEE
ncbi:peptide/nickel transport system substrate-binding protein [Anaerobranca californiensis DSM 14826]|uniref:Peptide/nickel transport system substrate-binding protein n=1 Tax=Anaerobranca californiensis DSM 14826 TaxID=1120989 RepID=A0A1M6PR84_9FIRM|nr:ABC transporter substrate-binding protein [Anaerobranca californiensis]SHK10378.1 peptide/nickel transport system substrate-binding protein [Anaerobranca californiensis DSM 14826]